MNLGHLVSQRYLKNIPHENADQFTEGNYIGNVFLLHTSLETHGNVFFAEHVKKCLISNGSSGPLLKRFRKRFQWEHFSNKNICTTIFPTIWKLRWTNLLLPSNCIVGVLFQISFCLLQSVQNIGYCLCRSFRDIRKNFVSLLDRTRFLRPQERLLLTPS